MKANILDFLVTFVLILGGFNWLLIGAMNFDFVAWTFGSGSLLARFIYILVGLSALYVLLGVMPRFIKR